MATDRITGYDQGVVFKPACAVTTTGSAITLSSSQVVDGITLSAGMRVLVRNQASSVDNGIYLVQSSSWLRTADCDGNRDLLPASLVYVDRGSFYGGTLWAFNSSSTATSIAIGTDALTLTQTNMVTGQASAFMRNSFLPATTASSARTVLVAAGTTDANTFSATNTFSAAVAFSSAATFNSSAAFNSSAVFSAGALFSSAVTISSALTLAGAPAGNDWRWGTTVTVSTTLALSYPATAIASTAVEIELLWYRLLGAPASQQYTAFLESSASAVVVANRLLSVDGGSLGSSNTTMSNVFILGYALSTLGAFHGRLGFSRLSASSTIWIAEGKSFETSSGRFFSYTGVFEMIGTVTKVAFATTSTTVFMSQSGTLAARWR